MGDSRLKAGPWPRPQSLTRQGSKNSQERAWGRGFGGSVPGSWLVQSSKVNSSKIDQFVIVNLARRRSTFGFSQNLEGRDWNSLSYIVT